jgi:D-lactate dehydrogenase
LSEFQYLPISGEYLHRDCYDAAKNIARIPLCLTGAHFVNRYKGILAIFFSSIKHKVDILAEKFKFLPNKFLDRLMQFLSNFWPNHLPNRMEKYRDQYEHHWGIEMSDEGIDEAKTYFVKFFTKNEGSFFECTKKEGKKALLHRFVAGGAIGRYHALHQKKSGGVITTYCPSSNKSM